MVTGLDTFRRYFADHNGSYVLIGGAACDIWFSQAGIRYRSTKDFDVVLCVEVVDGRSILPREIMGIVENHSETRHGLFQIIRRDREMPELSIRIGYDPERLGGSPDGLKARLHDDIAAQIGVKTVIELVEEAELLKLGPPHKIPRVTKK